MRCTAQLMHPSEHGAVQARLQVGTRVFVPRGATSKCTCLPPCRPDEAFTTERAVRAGRANASSGRIQVTGRTWSAFIQGICKHVSKPAGDWYSLPQQSPAGRQPGWKCATGDIAAQSSCQRLHVISPRQVLRANKLTVLRSPSPMTILVPSCLSMTPCGDWGCAWAISGKTGWIAGSGAPTSHTLPALLDRAVQARNPWCFREGA